jgi:hypothetical protein
VTTVVRWVLVYAVLLVGVGVLALPLLLNGDATKGRSSGRGKR